MKAQTVLIALLIAAAISSAQTTRDGDFRGPRPHTSGGRVLHTPHPTEPVVSLGQLIDMSKLIVDGAITSVLPAIHPDPDPDSDEVETHSIVSITEVLLRLDLGADGLTRLVETPPEGSHTILLAQWGGKAGKWEVDVPSDPLVKQGERYILFLIPDDRTQPPNTSRLPRYHAVGAWSGKVKVENGKIHFLPSAAPGLHRLDNSDVSAFIATVRRRISLTVPKIQLIRRPGQ